MIVSGYFYVYNSIEINMWITNGEILQKNWIPIRKKSSDSE